MQCYNNVIIFNEYRDVLFRKRVFELIWTGCGDFLNESKKNNRKLNIVQCSITYNGMDYAD